jgi:recombination protein RecR
MLFENTGQFRGLYHVLGGVISPIDGVHPSDLEIESLVERVKAGGVKEVVLALSTTMEGDTTAYYIARKLAEYPITLTTIARGVSVGDELQYADELTLGKSIVNRVPYSK